MKKQITTLTFFLLTILVFAQTNYDKGFKVGYVEGYCYNEISCVPPIPPLTPIPYIGETTDNYQDGYNRGFKLGLENKAKNNQKKTATGSNNSAGTNTYQQQSYVSTYVPMNLDAIQAAGASMQARYDKNLEYRDKIIDWLFDLKSKINDIVFLSNMDFNYKKLRAMDGQDFGALGNELDIIKQDIREEIDKYNTRVREGTSFPVNSSQSKDSSQSTINKNYMTTIGEFGIYNEPIYDGKIIKMLPENTKVIVYGKVDWFYIVEYEGIKGYMKEAFLK